MTPLVKHRMEFIQKIKEEHPELNELLQGIDGSDGLAQLNILIERLRTIDTGSEPNAANWANGMTLQDLVGYLAKYKKDYLR